MADSVITVIDEGTIQGRVAPGVNAISDNTKHWELNIFAGAILRVWSRNASGFTITEIRSIQGNNAQTLVLDSNITTVLEPGSHYEIIDAVSADIADIYALLGVVDGKVDVVDGVADSIYALLAQHGSLGSGRVYNVDHYNGNDTNPGTQDEPFQSIGAALAVVTDGDTIKIAPGVYDEDGLVNTHSYVTIVGNVDAPGAVWVTNTAGGATEIFTNTGGEVTIEGMQIYGSGCAGGINGIDNNGELFTVKHCMFVQCSGSSLYLHNNGHGVISDCEFLMNGDDITLSAFLYVFIDLVKIIGDGNGVGVDGNTAVRILAYRGQIQSKATAIDLDAGCANNSFFDLGLEDNTTNWSNAGGATNRLVSTEEESQITADNTVQQDLKDIYDQVGMGSSAGFMGVVTSFTDANNFVSDQINAWISALGGGNDFLNSGWRVMVIWDAGGASAAPQGEAVLITDYDGTDITHNAFSANLAAGDIVAIIPPYIYESMLIRGGAYSLYDLIQRWDATLDLAYSPDSGSFTCDGNENDIYNESSDHPFDFHPGWIDFTGANAGAGENTTITVYTTDENGNERWVWGATYLAAAVPSPARVQVPNADDGRGIDLPIKNISGIRITEQQAAIGGGWNTLYADFFDSKRGG